MDRRTASIFYDVGLTLIVITTIHAGTPQSQDGRMSVPVATPAEAIQQCSERQQHESILTHGKPQERGRTTVRCLLRHADGTMLPLVPSLEIDLPR